MGATLGSALQSPEAVSVTRPASSPWKATLWSPQAMWIPPEQGEGCDVPLPALQPQWKMLWLQRPPQPSHMGCGDRNKAQGQVCAAHLGLSGGKRVVKEQWHVKRAPVRHGQSLACPREHPAPASAMNNIPWGCNWHRSTCRRVTPLFPPVFSLSTSIHFL